MRTLRDITRILKQKDTDKKNFTGNNVMTIKSQKTGKIIGALHLITKMFWEKIPNKKENNGYNRIADQVMSSDHLKLCLDTALATNGL